MKTSLKTLSALSLAVLLGSGAAIAQEHGGNGHGDNGHGGMGPGYGQGGYGENMATIYQSLALIHN